MSTLYVSKWNSRSVAGVPNPIFFLKNNGYLLTISIIFDRCCFSLAVVMPVKYVCNKEISICEIENLKRN